ncbi:MAG TPA: ATP-binding protein [Thermodesulfobacteriota bacterium]|nr:ATP-binding protein [Thermodesulfobacteriota bacterium]
MPNFKERPDRVGNSKIFKNFVPSLLEKPKGRRTLIIGGAVGGTLLLLIIVTVLGLSMAGQAREIISEQFNRQQLGVCRLIASRIEDSFSLIAKELAVLNLSESLDASNLQARQRRMGITLSNLEEYGAEEIHLIDASGREAWVLNKQGLFSKTQERYLRESYLNWAKGDQARGRIYYGEILSELDAKGNTAEKIALVTPHYTSFKDQKSPRFSGVLLLLVNATALVEKHTASITSGKTGYAWVIDGQGQFLYHPEKGFVGENAFAVREKREPRISFDAINRIQKEKMLTGQEGMGFYTSGWHRGLKGNIRKLIAYSPVFLSREGPKRFWSVAVAAPVSEVEGVIHSLHVRQLIFQLIIFVALIAGGVGIIASELRYGKALRLEVQQAIADLRESEERNRYLIENAEDIIITMDEDGKVYSINPYGASQFDRPVDYLVGQNLFDLFDAKSARVQRDLLKRVVTTQKSKALEYQAVLRDQEHWFHAQFKPLLDDQGKLLSILCIIRDTTESKIVEQQLANTEKLASLGKLAAGVAHEINNPLGVILGFTDFLLEKAPPDSQELKVLRTIERQGLQCKKIVENLLSFARIPEKSVDYSKVNEELEKILAVVQNTLMIHKVKLEKRFQENLPDVKADSRQLQQVLLNIINNAVDAMGKEGGRLIITSQLSQEANHVEILLQDTGPGIREEHLGKIFDPFFTTKGVGKGTGLGLSVSYAIITKFGGSITILDSRTAEKFPGDSGTTFKISLPVKA